MEDIEKLEERVKFKIALSKIDDEKRYSNQNKQELNLFKKISLVACVSLIVTTGIVFAKDVEKIIKSIFLNSKESIDIAVENGYVQEVDYDYIYDNGIGIKIDKVLIDNSCMEVSFLYDILSSTSINNIELYEYDIRANQDTFLYGYSKENTLYSEIPIINSFSSMIAPQKTDETHFEESKMYFSSASIPHIDTLHFNIKKIKINDTIIRGNWKIQFDIDSKLNERAEIIYISSENQNVVNSNISLSETTLTIDLKLNSNYEWETSEEFNLIPELKKENGDVVTFREMDYDNLENSSIYNIKFDLSKYDKNIDKLYFKICLSKTKEINIELIKK